MIWRPTLLDRVLSNMRLPAKKIIAIIDIGKNSFAYINESIFWRSSPERYVFLKDNKEYKEEVSKVLLDRKKEAEIIRGELKQDEFVYVDHLGNFRDTPPDPEEKEEVNLESIQISTSKKIDSNEKVTGKVTFYDPEKGFGFLKNTETQDSYFFHFSECKDTLGVGDKVEFDTVRGEKGLNAVKINKI